MSDDSKIKGSSRESLSYKIISKDSLETLFLVKYEGGEHLVKIHMPPPVMIETEIKDVYQRRERLIRFIKIYWEVTSQDPNDIEISRNTKCHGQHDAVS